MTTAVIDDKLDQIIDLLRAQKEVLRAKEAAEYLCIGYDTLMRYTRIGEIRAARNGSAYIYKREWLDEWLEGGGTR